ncbi:hypothetical protein HK102_008876, partial [Quaeritorhiza haematococci]
MFSAGSGTATTRDSAASNRLRFLAREGWTMRVAVHARISTHDQQTLDFQISAPTSYVAEHGWQIGKQIRDVGSGAKERGGREVLWKSSRRREIDVIIVPRLDRRGRSVADLMTTLREPADLGVGFVALTEALDLATPTGRATAGMLAVFAEFEREILREQVRAGSAQAREEGRPYGRPKTASSKSDEVVRLKAE